MHKQGRQNSLPSTGFYFDGEVDNETQIKSEVLVCAVEKIGSKYWEGSSMYAHI